MPVFYLDLAANNPVFTFRFDLVDSLDFRTLNDLETITIFGKTYTIMPNHDIGDDLTLYGQGITRTVWEGEPAIITNGGDDYLVEVLGRGLGETANLQVTGSETEIANVAKGDLVIIAGLEVYIDDVFINYADGQEQTIVSLFSGSEKMTILNRALDPTCYFPGSFEEIAINGNEETDIYACIVSDNDINEVDGLYLRIYPWRFIDPATGDEWDWLVMGRNYTDPLFGFSLEFHSIIPTVQSRPVVEIYRSGDTYSIEFANNDGDEYDFEFVTGDGTTLDWGYDGDFMGISMTSFMEDQYFILESAATDLDDVVTYIFEVRDINAYDQEVTLKDIGTGATKLYELDDEIMDTGTTITAIAADTFTISSSSEERIVAEGGIELTWEDHMPAGWLSLAMQEEFDDFDDVVIFDANTLQANITIDAIEDIDMANAYWAGSGDTATATDSDGDYLYGISEYGTWFEQEIDEESDWLQVYYANEETDFIAFLNAPETLTFNETPIEFSDIIANGETFETGDQLTIWTSWTKQRVRCYLYANEELVASMESLTNTCAFSQQVTLDHYPTTEVYVTAYDNTGASANSTPVTITVEVCNAMIDQNITLTDDLSCTDDTVLAIAEEGVTIDCAGHSISSSDEEATGIRIFASNSAIRNCVFSSLRKGIVFDGDSTENVITNATFIADDIAVQDKVSGNNTILDGAFFQTSMDAPTWTWHLTTHNELIGSTVTIENIVFEDDGVLEMADSTLIINGVPFNENGNLTSFEAWEGLLNDTVPTGMNFSLPQAKLVLSFGVMNTTNATLSIMSQTLEDGPAIPVLGVDITLDQNAHGVLTWVLIKAFYDQDMVDELDIDEDSIAIYYWNETAWVKEPVQGIDLDDSYVWANVTHLSLFGLFGSENQAAPTTTKPKKSGGGGGGSSSAGTTSPSDSIVRNWLNLEAGDIIDFTISSEKIAIKRVTFAVQEQIPKLRVEVSAVNQTGLPVAFTPPSYAFTKMVIEGVGEGFLEGTALTFAVNKTWIDEQGASDDIKLFRLVENSWEPQPTVILTEDGQSSTYHAQTDGFGFFAIGVPPQATAFAKQEETLAEPTTFTAPVVQEEEAGTQAVTLPTGMTIEETDTQTSGHPLIVLGAVGALLVIAAVALYLRRK